jgi:hypothetical protein
MTIGPQMFLDLGQEPILYIIDILIAMVYQTLEQDTTELAKEQELLLLVIPTPTI